MELVVLSVPGCPNVALLDERLAVLLIGRDDVRLVHRQISDLNQANRESMHGSPTLLVDGTDPFADPDAAPSVSCRLFPDDHGHLQRSPSFATLAAALTPESAAGTRTVDIPHGLDAVLGVGSQRSLAPVEDGQRAMQQAVLRSFAATGRPPAKEALDRVAADGSFAAQEVLSALHRGDYVRLDTAGRIVAAYPFSPEPTRHRVTLPGGHTVFAMCAIDALGIPAMLGTDARIDSAGLDGHAIAVTVRGDQAEAVPASAVVFVGADRAGGPAAEVCCGHLNFFADRSAAETWAAVHPDVPGTVLDLDQAHELGREIFGSLLNS